MATSKLKREKLTLANNRFIDVYGYRLGKKTILIPQKRTELAETMLIDKNGTTYSRHSKNMEKRLNANYYIFNA